MQTRALGRLPASVKRRLGGDTDKRLRGEIRELSKM